MIILLFVAFLVTAAVMMSLQAVAPDSGLGTNGNVAFYVLIAAIIVILILCSKFSKTKYAEAIKQGIKKGMESGSQKPEFPLDEIGNYRVIEFDFPKVIAVRLPKRPRREEFRLKFVGLNSECRPVLYLITEFDEMIACDYEELKSSITWDKTKYDTFERFAFSSFGVLNYRKWQKAKIDFKYHLENKK